MPLKLILLFSVVQIIASSVHAEVSIYPFIHSLAKWTPLNPAVLGQPRVAILSGRLYYLVIKTMMGYFLFVVANPHQKLI